MSIELNGTTGITTPALDSVAQFSSADMPAGSVLQVVQSVWTTKVSTTSTSFITTGHTASITPSSASNKILVSLAGGGWYNANVSNKSNWTTIYRDAINIEPVANGGFEVAYFNAYAATPHSVTYLDNPATTSATTYTIYFRTESGGTNVYTQLSGGTPGVPVTLTLMEIAG